MPAFAYLVGKYVEVSYRAGEVHMTVCGTLALDTGMCIHLEDRFSQGGRSKTLRIEIPYAAVMRIHEMMAQPEPTATL